MVAPSIRRDGVRLEASATHEPYPRWPPPIPAMGRAAPPLAGRASVRVRVDPGRSGLLHVPLHRGPEGREPVPLADPIGQTVLDELAPDGPLQLGEREPDALAVEVVEELSELVRGRRVDVRDRLRRYDDPFALPPGAAHMPEDALVEPRRVSEEQRGVPPVQDQPRDLQALGMTRDV